MDKLKQIFILNSHPVTCINTSNIIGVKLIALVGQSVIVDGFTVNFLNSLILNKQ